MKTKPTPAMKYPELVAALRDRKVEVTECCSAADAMSLLRRFRLFDRVPDTNGTIDGIVVLYRKLGLVK